MARLRSRAVYLSLSFSMEGSIVSSSRDSQIDELELTQERESLELNRERRHKRVWLINFERTKKARSKREEPSNRQ